MDRHTYRVELGYDGRAFAGFARQPGRHTVEAALVAALQPLVPELAGVSVGGRTDRGVSATHQVISFWSRQPLDPRAIHDALTPLDDLAVHDVRPVDRWFHAQYSARARRYVYEHPAVDGADARAVDRLLGPLVGTRCFFAFARDTPPNKTTVRRMFEARARDADGASGPVIRFDFAAEGFLRHQVRVLVSTALREARLGAPDDALVELAARQERWQTAKPAPAEGLTLVKVGYEPQAARGPRQRPRRATMPRSSADIG